MDAKKFKLNNVNKYAWRFLHVVEAMLVAGAFITLGFILLAPKIYGVDNEISDRGVRQIGRWVRVDEDGNTESVTLPANLDGSAGGEMVLETVLPNSIGNKDYLALRLYKYDMDFYVDGELRESFKNPTDTVFRRENYARYIFAPLEAKDSGKTVRMVITQRVPGNIAIDETCLGEKNAITRRFCKTRIPELMLGVILMLVGLFAIAYGIVIYFLAKHPINIDYLGWALCIIALWDFTQTEFRDFFFSNLAAISMVPAICLMGFPVAICLYFNSLQEYRYYKAYSIYLGVCFINFLTTISLQLAKVVDVYQGFWRVFALLGGCIILVLATVFVDYRKGHAKRYPYVVIGTIILALSGVGQIVVFNVLFKNARPLCLIIGVFLFVLFAVVHYIKNVIQLDLEKKSAQRTAELKGKFLASMSHEIRTPINAVLGMNEMILRESNNEIVRDYAKEVETAGRVLLSLINDILDFSKLESGNMPVVAEEYDVKSVLLSIFHMVDRKAKEKGLDLIVQVSSDIPSKLKGDSIRVTQIVTNILTNAVKYTDNGSVTLEISCGGTNERSTELLFKISDTGRGIRQEDISKLFISFQRVDERNNASIEGTGLGLAITKSLVDLMGGSIEVNSEYGKGSCFMIKLPQSVVDIKPMGELFSRGENEAAAVTKPKKEVLLTQDVRILAVDDVPVNLKVIASFLKKTGIEVDTAASGDECIELACTNRYDIIFLDHMMPEKDGIQTLHEMRAMDEYMNEGTPVIMITANAIMGAREQFLQEGFDAFISKPFSFEEIQRVIVNFLPESKIVSGGNR